MPRGRVPFAGRRGARINVGLAFRDDAEFQRRADRDVVAGADRGLEIIDGRLVEVRLGGDRGDLLAALAGRGSDRRPCPSSSHAPVADAAAVKPAGRRREHHAELGRAALDEADVDGVIVAAANEFLGAVERVDQEIGVVVRGNSPGRDFFFGDDRDARAPLAPARRGSPARRRDRPRSPAMCRAWLRPRSRAATMVRIASPASRAASASSIDQAS